MPTKHAKRPLTEDADHTAKKQKVVLQPPMNSDDDIELDDSDLEEIVDAQEPTQEKIDTPVEFGCPIARTVIDAAAAGRVRVTLGGKGSLKSACD